MKALHRMQQAWMSGLLFTFYSLLYFYEFNVLDEECFFNFLRFC